MEVVKGRTMVTVVVCAAVAGCGSGAPKKQAAKGCRTVVARALGAGKTTPRAPEYGITGCAYHLPNGATVTVIDDRNPQPLKRFERAVVETDQNAVWSTTPRLAPQLLNGIGMGADWVPATATLLATDNVSDLTIRVAPDDAARAKALAIAAAKATLRTQSGA